MVAVDEDFFVLVRVDGADTRVLLSDITAADEWDLATSAVEHLGLPLTDSLGDESDEPVPAGHLDLLSDLGVTAMDLGALLDDPDLYPDEILSDVASRLGFGELFDDVVGFASA
jgi:putative tRNA adenosine deaminase-associated protein